MILTRHQLENINDEMIGRGAPDKIDQLGYNVPDFNKLSSIWYGATDEDLYEISSRLLKYYNTQLGEIGEFTRKDLIESIEYYKDLKDQGINKKSVTVGISNDLSVGFVSFKYDEEFIYLLRAKQYKFDREYKAWYGPISKLKNILESLEKLGADTKNSMVYLENLEIDENILFEKEQEVLKEGFSLKKLKVNKIGEDELSLIFEFDNDLINAIKTLKTKSFNWNTKAWIIHEYEAKSLYENITHLGYDLSSLRAYIDKAEPPKVKLFGINGNDVEFSFPYMQQVVDRIKELTYYEFNKSKKSWIVDIREKDIFLESISDLIDTSELRNILYNTSDKKIQLKDYSYLKRKPYSHQLEAASFLLNANKGLLADEMGTGKTLSSILSAYSLPSPRLIICPASLKLNWAKEVRMVDYTGKISVIGEDINYDADWIIINYDILEREFKRLDSIEFTSIILDEAHYIKSVANSGKPNSKRAKYTMILADKCDFVFSLTGTPITNKPKDIFNILKVCDHILSRNFFNFGQKYCGASHNGFGWDFNKSSNEEELHEKIKPIMIRRLKKDMLELPDKIRRFIPVEINRKSYDQAVSEYKSKKALLNREGEHLAYLTTIKHILAKEKVDATIEIAENILDGQESVVIFTNYNAVVDRLTNHFGDLSTKITGSCTSKQRQQAVDDFQSGNKKVIVANIIAAGVGITLVEANNLIFNDFDWVPSNHFQAEDRIHRIGQSKNCLVNYVYANKAEIDEYMAQMLERKSTYINEIIDGGEGEQLNIQSEIIQNLYKTA